MQKLFRPTDLRRFDLAQASYPDQDHPGDEAPTQGINPLAGEKIVFRASQT